MPRIKHNANFYRSVKSADSVADRYITFGAHATYLLNTAGGMSIWAKRGAWRSDGENILELYGTGCYVRVTMTGRSITATAFANSSTIVSSTYNFTGGALEAWHNVVVTWDSSSLDVYLDKTRVINSVGDKRLSFATNPTFYVGTGNAAGSGFMFDGYHTRAALYNAKLSQTDVNQIYDTISPTSEVSAWDYTDTSGSTITLTRGSGNNGTIVQGSIQLDVPVRPRNYSQNIPYSLRFNGSTQYGSKSIAFGSATKIVWDGWVYPEDHGVASGIVCSSDIAGQALEIQYNNTAIAANSFVFLVGVSSVYNYWTSAKCPPGRWYRLTCVYDSSEGVNTRTRIYINGQLSGAIGLANNVSPTYATQTYEMAVRISSGLYFKGFLSSTRIVSGYAWTAAEVATAYYQGVYPSSGTNLAIWAFSDSIGSTVTDTSGNSNNITLYNSPTWSGEGPLGSRAKSRTISYASSFNGSNQYGTITNLGFGASTQVTLAGWVRVANWATGAIMESSTNYNSNNALVLISDPGGTISASTHSNTGGIYSGCTSSSLQKGVWYRYVLTIDQTVSSNQVNLYLNGKLNVSSRANNSNLTTGIDTANLYLGMRAGASVPFQGDLTLDYVVTGKVFTSSEILSEFLTGERPSGGTLIGSWAWTEGSGSSIADGSGNSKTITLTNSPAWITSTSQRTRQQSSNRTQL